MKNNLQNRLALIAVSLLCSVQIYATILNQPSGTINVQNSAYTNDMSEIWEINTGTAKPVRFIYTVDIEEEWDYIEIYSVDASGNRQSTPDAVLTGNQNGQVSTTLSTGRALVHFYSDGSVSHEDEEHYGGALLNFVVDNSTTLTDNLYVHGLLGIGTINPLAKLHVDGSIRGNLDGGALRVQTEYGYTDIGPKNGGYAHFSTDLTRFIFDKPVYLQTGDLSSYLNTNLNLQTWASIQESTITRMTILASNGNTGIGTTTPSQLLDLERDADFQLRLGNAGGMGYNIGRNRTTGYLTFYGNQSGYNGYEFGGVNGTKMIIKNNGNLGVLASNPLSALQIGDYNNGLNHKLTIPGLYSFEQLNLGQFGNGASGLELVNHTNTTDGYGVRLIANCDDGVNGLQIKTSNSANSYSALNYTTRMVINTDGNVGIGTTAPDALLTVNGVIHAREVKIELSGPLADYVFDPEYNLMPLHQVENFVKTNKHLPEIPSATEVKEKGMSVGEMQNKLLQKIEELTLYTIQQQKQIQDLQLQINALRK